MKRSLRNASAWMGDWEERVLSRLRAHGHGSATSLVESHPTLPLAVVADLLAIDESGADRADIAPVQLSRLWFEEAIANGPEAVERCARTALQRFLQEEFPFGIPRQWNDDSLARLAYVQAVWVDMLGPECTPQAERCWSRLELPGGWLPLDPDDPVLLTVFAEHWRVPQQ